MMNVGDMNSLLQLVYGRSGSSNVPGMMPISSLNTSSGLSALAKAGINVNSNQYKAAISAMTSGGGGAGGYISIQAIKNWMTAFDEDGDYIDPTTGLAGLLITDENRASSERFISIPESSREEMFQLMKKEYLRENGIANGDTTNRTDVYINLYRKMEKDDRLAAGHTLSQYERAYRNAFYSAVKEIDPNWDVGMSIPEGALDGITRESVEATLIQSGNTLVRKRGVLDAKA